MSESHAKTIPIPEGVAVEDYSQFRFRGGVMKGLLVTSAPTRYLRECIANLHPNTDTVKACRWEIARRERMEAR